MKERGASGKERRKARRENEGTEPRSRRNGGKREKITSERRVKKRRIYDEKAYTVWLRFSADIGAHSERTRNENSAININVEHRQCGAKKYIGRLTKAIARRMDGDGATSAPRTTTSRLPHKHNTHTLRPRVHTAIRRQMRETQKCHCRSTSAHSLTQPADTPPARTRSHAAIYRRPHAVIIFFLSLSLRTRPPLWLIFMDFQVATCSRKQT